MGRNQEAAIDREQEHSAIDAGRSKHDDRGLPNELDGEHESSYEKRLKYSYPFSPGRGWTDTSCALQDDRSTSQSAGLFIGTLHSLEYRSAGIQRSFVMSPAFRCVWNDRAGSSIAVASIRSWRQRSNRPRPRAGVVNGYKYSTRMKGMKGITAGKRVCVFFHPLHLLHPCSKCFHSSEAVNNRMRHFFCRHV